MDEQNNQTEPGGGFQAPVPQAAVVPMGDQWAAGVNPVAVAPRSRRFRWGVAGAVVLVVAVATAAGAFVLSGAAGAKSLTAAVAPKNSIYFMEVRTDLPGDQRAKLADFMSHFPGFKDRSQFDNALDEMLNKLTGSVSPDLQYTSAFKPWIQGEVSVALTSFGLYSTSSSTPIAVQPGSSLPADFGNMPASNPPGAVAIFALKDRAAAETWVTGELGRLNVATTSTDYAGTKLYTTGAAGGSSAGAYAITDQDLLLGTVDGVKAALDSKTNGSLADNPNYQAAMKSLTGDSLARFYLDPRALVQQSLASYEAAMSAMSGMFGAAGATLPPVLDSKNVPAWLAGSIRAESDRMVLEMSVPQTGAAGLGNHTSRIAGSLPASTVGVFEMHSIGQTVNAGISALESQAPMMGMDTSSIKSVTDALKTIGGIEWLGDGTAVVTKDGSAFGGGLVVEATDAATAQSKVDLASNLIALSGLATGLKSDSETYKGQTITVVAVPAGSGSDSQTIDVAIGTMGNLVVVGYTDAFVKAVLDTTSANSLAVQPDYSATMNAVGNSNEQSAYINVPALEDQIGLAALASNSSRWTQDYKPYFDHLGGIAYAVIDGTTITVRYVVTAR
jgi:hypothetical protein